MSFRIGITGKNGFIGTHLFNKLCIDKIEQVGEIFSLDNWEPQSISDFVKNCDIIIHLAAINRHDDEYILYNKNVGLIKQLIDSMENTNSRPYVIFASSIQEEQDNLYGKSKRDGRLLLEEWSAKNNAKFTGIIIPNVFGPFGRPFYNSVFATFCYQLANSIKPEIKNDNELNIIYINELIDVIELLITSFINKESVPLIFEFSDPNYIKVSTLLKLLYSYHETYGNNKIIPNLNSEFNLNLFNTYMSYIPLSNFPVLYEEHVDNRGKFVELINSNGYSLVSYSTTKPNITRGNHFHTRKIERFSVIDGNAIISLRRIGTNRIHKFTINGNKPGFIDIPIWYTHSITNVGNKDLITVFWTNEMFNPNNSDTYFEEVCQQKD